MASRSPVFVGRLIADCEKTEACRGTILIPLHRGPFDGIRLRIMPKTFVRTMRGDRCVAMPLEATGYWAAIYDLVPARRPFALFNCYAISEDCEGE